MKRREERDDESKGRRSFNIEKATAEIRDNSQVKTMMSLVSCVCHSLSYGLFSVEARKPDHRGEDSMGRREVKGEMLNECTE